MSASFQSAVDVQLVVDGEVHRGWRAMKAIVTLDAPCAKFTLELAERWADAEDARPRTVKPGAAWPSAMKVTSGESSPPSGRSPPRLLLLSYSSSKFTETRHEGTAPSSPLPRTSSACKSGRRRIPSS